MNLIFMSICEFSKGMRPFNEDLMYIKKIKVSKGNS